MLGSNGNNWDTHINFLDYVGANLFFCRVKRIGGQLGHPQLFSMVS